MTDAEIVKNLKEMADPSTREIYDYPDYMQMILPMLKADSGVGEQLLEQIYNAIQNTPISYRQQILFVITFDESGGTFDHVVPPSTTPPDNSGPGEMGFGFDRLGIRVPMIWINDFIEPGTTIQQPLQHTSFMRFLRTLWNIPGYLTARDQNAPDVPLSVFNSAMRTAPWPTVTARTTYNPAGNSTNAKVNELSYFVDQLQNIFLGYLNTIKCDVETFFGGTCVTNWASTLSFSPIWLLITMIVSYMFA